MTAIAIRPETDPALAAHEASPDAHKALFDAETAATDSKRVIAIVALEALIATKQDANTAATQAQLQAAQAALSALIDLKQDAATAATDAELAEEAATRASLDERLLSGDVWGVPANDYVLTIVGGVPRWAPSAAGPPPGPPAADGLLRTEAGDYLTTEGGDLLLMEA